MRITKVAVCLVAMEMIARTVKRRLKGFGRQPRRMAHQ